MFTIDRRTITFLIFLSATGVLTSCTPPPRQPFNLLVIGIDTLRADALGSYGSSGNPTPNMDALAENGIRFAEFNAPAPWTLPSFATLHTGLQPQTHGAGRRLEDPSRAPDFNFARLPEGTPTLATTLAKAGYVTGGFYTNPYLRPEFGLHQGFADYRTVAELGRAGVTVSAAGQWLAAQGEDPFFLFVHLIDPHVPYAPPKGFCDQWLQAHAPDWGEEPCFLKRFPGTNLAESKRPKAQTLYRAEVAYTDLQVGRLLTRVEELGLTQNTLILLVSDHGESFWEHEKQGEEFGYYADADHGHTLYRTLLRVPAILAGPGLEPLTIDDPAEMADLFPTLLGLLGVAAPPNQGRDLGDLVHGRPTQRPAPPRIADFLLYGEPRTAVSKGDWKLIYKTGEPAISELYRLDQDPDEQRNRIAEYPQVAKRLRRLAEEALRARRARARELATDQPAPAMIDEEARERLRSLGYTQ